MQNRKPQLVLCPEKAISFVEPLKWSVALWDTQFHANYVARGVQSVNINS